MAGKSIKTTASEMRITLVKIHLDCLQKMLHLIVKGRLQLEIINIFLSNVFKLLSQAGSNISSDNWKVASMISNLDIFNAQVFENWRNPFGIQIQLQK